MVNGFLTHKTLLPQGYLLLISIFMMASFPAFSDPLAETREILFNCPASEPDCEQGEIAKQAADLQSPAAMYEYVRNTHEYTLYHGSRSNTINTWFGKRGSDVDIASVLIAMYRSQAIPARYAVGTISAPATEVANWLAVKNISLAAAIMDNQGIQNVNLTTDGAIQVIEFEHTWVQVQVPYDDYRGAFATTINCTITPEYCQWINIDPSWKQREFHNQGIDIYGVVNFDYTRYYNAIKNDDPEYRDKNPTEIYEAQILDYLKINFPGKTLNDVADPGTIISVQEGILPASLPYKVISSINTYDSIVLHDADTTQKGWAKFLTIRYSLGAFTFTGSLVGPFILSSSSDPIALADLSTKRITLSYFEGNQISGDPYEHHQMVVRLDGQIIDIPILIAWQNDQAQYLGRLFDVTFELDGAPSTTGGTDNLISATYQNLMFGGYYVIGTGGDTSNWSQVHRAAKQLLQANETYPIVSDGAGVPYVDSNGNGVIDTGEGRLLDDPVAQDELTGGLLNVAMSQYYSRFVTNTRRLDALNHVISPIEGFVGIVSSTYDVDYLGTTAFSVMPGGLLIDMKGQRFSGSWRNDAPGTFANAHFELVGHAMSSLEHEIWQEITGFDAVSTVRGIQMALANGTQLLDLTTGSAAEVSGMYADFGFTSQPQLPFSISVRDVFTTRPTTWSHSTTAGDDGFTMLKKLPSSVNDPRSAQLTYTNTFLYDNVGCFDSQEQAIRDLIAQYGGTATLNAGNICGYAYTSGTTLLQLLSGFETYYNNFFSIGSGGSFDYLDQNQGFNPADFTFRDSYGAPDIHSMDLVYSIRDALLFAGTVGGNPARWEYRIPARKTSTGFNIFSVYLKKIYDTIDNSLASQSFIISNDGFTAGGGWVDGSETLSLANVGGSVVKPLFDNRVFTDKNLVAVTNNDLIRTPSTADPISTVTGNMYHDETDISIKGRGLDYAFTRSYNSAPARADKDGSLGFGWTHSYNMSLRANDYGDCPNCAQGTGAGQAPENGNGITSSITYIDERGGEHTYLLNADGSATRAVAGNPPGEFNTLQLDIPAAGQYTLEFRNGVKYVFDGPASLKTTPAQTARLAYIEDAYNNRLNLSYDANGRLSSVVDNLGISGRTGLNFSYIGTNPHIQSISDWSGRTWQYGYDAAGNLTTVTNAQNDTLTYSYHPDSHLLNEVTLPTARAGKSVKTSFTYYRNNKAFSNANGLGVGETLDYDLYRQRTQVTDPRGFIRTHVYDRANGALLKLEEPDGAILRFANNYNGLRYSKTDGLGYETQYSFMADRSISAVASDNFGRVSRETDPLKQSTDLDYGLYDQPTTTRDKRGNSLTRTYYTTTEATTGAVAGKLQDVRATVNSVPNVLLASYVYYADAAQPTFGQLRQKVEYIDPADPARQRITDYVYEANGLNLQSQTVRGATTGGSVVTTFTYDALGRKTTQTLTRRTSATDATPLTLTTAYEYDALDRVIKVTDPRGDIRETVYDANGKVYQEKVHYQTATSRPDCAAPSGGYVVCTYATHAYDAADRRISTTDILGKTTLFEYDANGNLIKQTDANGHSTTYEYDAMNRKTVVIDANGYRREMKYDLAGNLISSTDANGNTTHFEYDALGRQTRTITPLGFETQTQYDANNNVTHVIDANAVAGLQPVNAQGATVYREYDELNRLTLERDALNGETRYTYDLLGNMTSITDAEGQMTTFIYDDLGRLTQTLDPVIEAPADKTDRILQYDEAGNVLLSEDRSGRQRRNSYDVLNRLVKTEYLLDNTWEQFSYDDFGDLIQVSNNDVTYNYTYTARHALASKTDSRLGKVMRWFYDGVGNVALKVDYQGEPTHYQYNSANRLVAERNAAYLQVSYHYDGAGRLIDRMLSNGAQTRYQYDADNRLIGLKNTSANKTVVEDLSYQRDNLGNITAITNATSGKTTAYTYDALYRLTNVDSSDNNEDRTYTYDKVGNRRSIQSNGGAPFYYIYNTAGYAAPPQGNRLREIRWGIPTGAVVNQFEYDDAGRVTGKFDGAGNLVYRLFYNGKGRATLVANPDSGFTPMGYDANDYRIKKGTKLYHLEGENLEAAYDSAGNLTDKYLRGVVVDEIVNGFHYNNPDDANDWVNYTFHHDHLNSVTALSGHTGSIEETTGYDAYGKPLSLTLPGTGNDMLYTGREYDRETGLYYYRARYYDPEIGRFVSEDPLGFKAGINFYSYVGNNPVNRNDPTGNCPSCIGALIGGGGELAAQFAESLITGNDFSPDFGRIGVAALAGATGVGIGNLANRLGRVASLAVNGVSEIGLNVGQEVINTGSFDAINNLTAKQAFLLGVTGVGSGVAGNFAADRFLSSSAVKLDLRQADRFTRIAQNRIDNGLPRSSRAQARFDKAFDITSSIDQAASIRSTITGGLVGSTSGTASRLFNADTQTSASGGFVLYPSKPNTNTLQSVYSK